MSLMLARQARVWLSALMLLGMAGSALAQAFSFVALGDLPYGSPEKAYRPYRQLIAAINQLKPAFSVHVGDIKSGSSLCSDREFEAQRAHFDLFEAPVVYTPGDNEWTDCHRRSNGGYEPQERLQALRRLFFRPGLSLGARPMALQSQAELMPEHVAFVENQRWLHQGVLFATVHVVGSNNNMQSDVPGAKGSTQKAIVESTNRTSAELDTIMLKSCVLSINGQDVINPDVVRNLGMLDRRTILKEIADRNPGPQLGALKKECKSCGQEVPLPLSLADLFRE